MNFDVAVIGAGPGGYVSAIRAAQLGLSVAIIEKDNVGGTCLNRGCIPTKALLQAAKIKGAIEESHNFGITSNVDNVDFKRVIERSREVVNSLVNGLLGLIAKNKIKLIKGIAEFETTNSIIVRNDNKSEEILFKNAIIAAGAGAKMIPSVPKDLLESGKIWTSKEALSPEKLPESVLIIGSGAIGIEFASFYNELGSKVCVLEILDRILPQEDKEISTAALKVLSSSGIEFKLKTSAVKFSDIQNGIEVEFLAGDKKSVEVFEKVIVAIGVKPELERLKLDKIGIKQNSNKTIIVNEYQQTNIPNIYAIGDIVNVPWLAHKASQEGIIAAEHIKGVKLTPTVRQELVPSCTYCNPQIASIGISEDKAKEKSLDILVGKSYMRGNGKALAGGDSFGFVKVIFDKSTGELLGASMIGHEVSELISVFSLAMTAELTERDFMNTIFPHPTVSEVIKEAVMNAYSCEIHG